MVKRAIKRISVSAVVVCLLAGLVPSGALAADPVSFTEATKMGATIIDLYGAYNNTSLAYDVANSGSALTVIENLYQNYSSSASDPYTLAAIGAAAAAAGAIAVIYDAVTGQGYIQLTQEQYISSMDGYWDYQLADLGFVRDSVSGLFSWTENDGVIDTVPVFSFSLFSNVPITNTNAQSLFTNGLILEEPRISNTYYQHAIGKASDVPMFVFGYLYGTTMNFVVCSTANNTYYRGDNESLNNLFFTSDSTSIPYLSIYRNQFSGRYNSNFSYSIPIYSTIEEGLDAYIAFINAGSPSETLSLKPTAFIGDPLSEVPTITLPNVADPDYVPSPVTIPTNIPWNPAWGDPLPDGVSDPEYGVPYPVTDPAILNDAVPGIWDYIVSNPIEVGDPNPDPSPDPGPSDPSEVFNPLLPVTLPSFDFSFSGIWHYVRDWVASLGSFLTMIFAVWAELPYAMVVPVYATAVILVVFGVYKRFFQ